MTYLVAICAGLSIALLAVAITLLVRRRRRLEIVLAIDLNGRGKDRPRGAQVLQSGLSNFAIRLESRSLAQTRLFKALNNRLFAANLKISATFLLALVFLVGLISFVVLSYFGTHPALAVLVSFVIQPWVFWQIIKRRIYVLTEEFRKQIPDFLLALSASLESGLSLLQAIHAIANTGSGQIERHFRRVMREVTLGVDFEDAVDALVGLMQVEELKIFTVAVETQREVGGNLAEALKLSSLNVRKRQDVENEVRILSADGRFSSVFLTLLPVSVFAFFFIFNRSYIEFFWTESVGIALAGVFISLTVVGALWVHLLVRPRSS